MKPTQSSPLPRPKKYWKPLTVGAVYVPDNRLVMFRAKKFISGDEYVIEISATQKKFYILAVDKYT